MGSKHGIGLEIATREATFVIEKYGLYEISASTTGSTVVMVHKGNADVKIPGKSVVDLKAGHELTITGSAVAEAKIAKGTTSDFQMWGQERAETLAALNNRIDPRDTLVGQRPGWSGAWVYSRFWGSYVYMPFDNFYTSPYGFWYNAYYNPYYWGNRGYVSGNSAAGGGGGKPAPPTKTSVAGVTSPTKGTGTSGPIQHNPSGDRPGPVTGRTASTTASTRVSPGPTHAGGGGGGYSRGGGSYGGGGGTYSGGSSGVSGGSSVSAPPASSAPTKGSSSGSSAPAGGVGRARGN
jgi:hypothetical protein